VLAGPEVNYSTGNFWLQQGISSRGFWMLGIVHVLINGGDYSSLLELVASAASTSSLSSRGTASSSLQGTASSSLQGTVSSSLWGTTAVTRGCGVLRVCQVTLVCGSVHVRFRHWCIGLCRSAIASMGGWDVARDVADSTVSGTMIVPFAYVAGVLDRLVGSFAGAEGRESCGTHIRVWEKSPRGLIYCNLHHRC
jgi:hypothetical protein